MATKKSAPVESVEEVVVEVVDAIVAQTTVNVVSGNLIGESGYVVCIVDGMAYVEIDGDIRTDVAYKIPVSSLANIPESV